MEDKQFNRIVRGALKNCIDAHGPITREHVFSASKRIHQNIYGYFKHNAVDNFKLAATTDAELEKDLRIAHLEELVEKHKKVRDDLLAKCKEAGIL